MMKFRSYPFSFSTVLKVQVGSVLYTQPLMYANWEKNDNARAHRNVLVGPRLLERGKGSSSLSSTLFARPSPVSLLKKTLSGRRY